MTRRNALRLVATCVGASHRFTETPSNRLWLALPVRLLVDIDASTLNRNDLVRFEGTLLSEAVADFRKALIQLDVGRSACHVQRYFDDAEITACSRKALNIIITDRVPMCWDRGRALCGIAFLRENCLTAVIAMKEAHPHLIPFVSTNTLCHEMVHLLRDVHRQKPAGLVGELAELKTDVIVTNLHWGTHTGEVYSLARRTLDGLAGY